MNTTTLFDILLALFAVLIAPFVVKGVVNAKSSAGKFVQVATGIVVVIGFLVTWGQTGKDPLQWMYCRLNQSAPSCAQLIRSETETLPSTASSVNTNANPAPISPARKLPDSSARAGAQAKGLAAITDDFNRPDGEVGNGWLNVSDNVGGDLSIVNGVLAGPPKSGFASVYRPINLAKRVSITGTLTQQQGNGGVPNRFESGFSFGGNGSLHTGYAVWFVHSDARYANSMVQLLYNGMVVSRIESPFQFQTAITVTVHFDASSGRFFGSVVEGANTFDFAFAPQGRRHLENNIGIELEGADTQSGATLRATMANVVVRL